MTVVSTFSVLIVHWSPAWVWQFEYPAKLNPLFGAAVSVIGPVPIGNDRVQFCVQVTVDWPGAETETVPSPAGAIRIERSAVFPFDPVKQTTFAVI